MRTTLLLLTSLFTVSLAACSDDGSDSRGSQTDASVTGTGSATDATGSSTAGGTTAAESTAAESTALPTTEPVTTTDATTTDATTTDGTSTGAPVELTCENYCGIYATACKDFAEYDNPEACLSQCKQCPPGEVNATAGDTLGCRLYHVGVAATTEPMVHCPHSGPNGAATCVEAGAPTCEAYCTQYFSSCTADLNLYAGDMAACMTQCAPWWPGKMGDAGGDSIGCRLYHAGVAMADPGTHCPHAGPGGADVCVVAP